MTLKIGELCAGYGGLGMAVEEVFGAELAWVSEFDEAPSRILAHHWPDVPNYGDMTKIDWAAIEPVDIISGGTPCQDLSHAGRRAGMTEGTRSNLWVQMREAIATIKPTYVVWENVRGAYSAEANSDLEPCPGCRDVWETPQTEGLFCEHLDVYSETFPTSGMTANGAAYELPTWEPRTGGSGSSSLLQGVPDSALLRTPMTGEGRKATMGTSVEERVKNGHQPYLTHQIGDLVFLRTPCAAETAGGPRNPNRSGATMRLSDQVREEVQRGMLLPTPTVGNATGGNATRSGARSHELLLPGVAMSLLPTPVAQPSGNSPEDHLRKKPGRQIVTDLAIIVENDLILSGGRTNQPSGAGNQLWEDVPLPLPSPLDAIADTDSAPVSPNG